LGLQLVVTGDYDDWRIAMNGILDAGHGTKRATSLERTKSVVSEWLTGTCWVNAIPHQSCPFLTVPTDAVEWASVRPLWTGCAPLHTMESRTAGGLRADRQRMEVLLCGHQACARPTRALSCVAGSGNHVFRILTSNCSVVKGDVGNARIRVVPDNELAQMIVVVFRALWVDEMKLRPGHVLSRRAKRLISTSTAKQSDARPRALVEGDGNDVADFIGADLVLPESSITAPSCVAHRFRRALTNVVCSSVTSSWGARDFAHPGVRLFYTVLQHASGSDRVRDHPQGLRGDQGAGGCMADQEPYKGPRIDPVRSFDRRRSIR